MSKSVKLSNNVYIDSSGIQCNSSYAGRFNLQDVIRNLVGDNKYNSNLNDIFEAGLYNYYIETDNRPSTQINGFAEWGLLIVIKTGIWYYQIAVGNYGSPVIAIRTNINTDGDPSGWSNWIAVS